MGVRDQVLERAADQNGYVTTRDAREMGIDPAQLRQLAARGRLERVGRGVYRAPILPRTALDEVAEAVMWTLGRGVASHETALVVHGLSDVSPSRVHLTVPRDNHPRAKGGELYRLHRRKLAHDDATVCDGIPVTTVGRTIRDCLAHGTDLQQLRMAVEQAEERGQMSRVQARDLRLAIDARGGPHRGFS